MRPTTTRLSARVRHGSVAGPNGQQPRPLAECSGDLIALSDQDDRWHPERLERLVGRLNAQPSTLLLHGNARMIDAQGQGLGSTVFEALAMSGEESLITCTCTSPDSRPVSFSAWNASSGKLIPSANTARSV